MALRMLTYLHDDFLREEVQGYRWTYGWSQNTHVSSLKPNNVAKKKRIVLLISERNRKEFVRRHQ